MSYDATYEAVFPGGNLLFTKGAVQLERGAPFRPPLPGKIRIKSAGYGGEQEVSFDGRVARKLDYGRKRLTEGLAERGGIGVAVNSSALTLLVWNMLWSDPLQYELAATQSSYVGLASVDGVLCHVVELRYAVPGTDVQGARWWFAVEDKLPRRFQKTLRTGDETVIHELSISNLRAGDGMASSAFALELPEGFAYQQFVPGQKPEPIPRGEMAPDWTLVDSSGRKRRLSEFRGQVVLLSFWASWCGYSKLGIPAVQEVDQKYKQRGLRVLGVNYQEIDGVNPVSYLKQKGADFETLLNGEMIAEQYRVQAVPAYYLVDKDGKIAWAILEYRPSLRTEMEKAIEQLLHESDH